MSSLNGKTLAAVSVPAAPAPPDTVTAVPVPPVPIRWPSGGEQVRVGLPFAGLPDQAQILRVIMQVTEHYAADPSIRALALREAKPGTDNDLPGMWRNLARWVMDHVRYVPDPTGTEWLQTPDVMLLAIANDGMAAGDCDDHVVLLNTLLNAVGIPAVPVAVKINGSPIFNHVVTGVYDGRLLTVDPCVKNRAQPVYAEKMIAI